MHNFHFQEMFIGCIKSVGTTLDWAFSEIMKNPIMLKNAEAEPEGREVFNRKGKVDEMQYLKLILKETLKLHPLAPLLFPRECGERCKINGFNIPRKASHC